MAEVAQDAQAAGQRQGTPYPHIADIRGIIGLAMRLVFFDKGPEFVDLGLGEMQIADESCAHGSRVLPCQVEPVENAIGRVMRETCHSPQTVALA